MGWEEGGEGKNYSVMLHTMEKDFDSWNEQKKSLEQLKSDIYFSEWDIWWCSVGLNIKSETCGKWESFRRPILVLTKLSHDTCIAIPLSSQKKKWTWFTTYDLHGEVSTALLYQIRMIHKNRFQRKIWQIDSHDFENIKKELKQLLKL